MKQSHLGIRVVRVALACLVLAAVCGRPGLAWNPGSATSPENKWVKVNGANSYKTDSYFSELDFSGGIYHQNGHIFILQHAIDILQNDGYDNWAALLQANLLHLASGSKHADAYKGRVEIRISLEILWGLIDVHTWAIDLTCAGGCEHYHNVNTDDGLDLTAWSMLGDAADFLIKLITMLGPSQYTYGLVDLDIDVVPDLKAQYPSGLKLSQKHFVDAQKAWDGNIVYPDRSALDSAFYELGWACHLMADLAVAQHLHDEFIGGHADYEDAADGLGEDSVYPNHHAKSAKGVYAFSSASGSAAVKQLGLKIVNTLYPDTDHHDKAEDGEAGDRWEALKKALPLAEKSTAALMAQFLHEAGIPSKLPPLEGYIRVMGGTKVPYAYVFYAPAGYTIQIEQNLTPAQMDPKKDWKGWSYIRADANGFYKLPVKKFRKYWLRPAMPGYSFTGQTSYNLEFGAKTVPALYIPPNISYSKDTLDLYLEPQPLKAVVAFLPGQEDTTKMKMVKFAGTDRLMTGLRPQIVTADKVLPLSKTKVSATLAEGIYKGVVKAECSASALQTQKSKGILPTQAYVVFKVSDLVSVFDGQTVQSAAEIHATVDKARVKVQAATAAFKSGAQLQPAAGGGDIGQATFQALQALLPSKSVSAGGSAKAKSSKLLTPSSAFSGSEGAALLLDNGLLLVPSKAGVEIEVTPDAGTGLLTPAEASLKLTTDASGAASFTVNSGSHAGKLVLRYKVTKNPKSLDIRPEGVVEILVQPGLDDADPAAETPVTLKQPLKLKLVPMVLTLATGRPFFRERLRVEPGFLPLGRRPVRRESIERPRSEEEEERRGREGEERARLEEEERRMRLEEEERERRAEEERRMREEEEARRAPEREREPGRREREGERAGAPIDISGEWQSNVRASFRVMQEGEEFSWKGIDRRQTGRGRLTGRRLEASWEGEPESGRAEGEVVETMPDGYAVLIHWSNGMVFFRSPRGEKPGPEPREEFRREEPPPREPEPEPPPREEPRPEEPRRREEPQPPPREEPQPPPREPREPQPEPQPQQKPIDISGRWVSNMRVVYQFRQQGGTFNWNASGQSQSFKGTLNGRTLQTSWPGRPASEKVNGEVVEVSDKGRALVIRWSNGIEFKR